MLEKIVLCLMVFMSFVSCQQEAQLVSEDIVVYYTCRLSSIPKTYHAVYNLFNGRNISIYILKKQSRKECDSDLFIFDSGGREAKQTGD